jgi:hypothetical protein
MTADLNKYQNIITNPNAKKYLKYLAKGLKLGLLSQISNLKDFFYQVFLTIKLSFIKYYVGGIIATA